MRLANIENLSKPIKIEPMPDRPMELRETDEHGEPIFKAHDQMGATPLPESYKIFRRIGEGKRTIEVKKSEERKNKGLSRYE